MDKYYITGDLEKTLIGGLKENKNSEIINIDNYIRESVAKIINKSFNSNVVEFISYDNIYNYFEELNNDDNFILTLDDGIYINNYDFNFSSSRTYNDKESILCKPENYQILQRNGGPVDNQNVLLASKVLESGKKDIVICDDGIFSGDTIKKIISNINSIGLNVSEIRVVLNFSGKIELEGIPIKSMFEVNEYIDWLDERDLFYGTKNGGASFKNGNIINGISYCSGSELANKKASIPYINSGEFCSSMITLNRYLYGSINSEQIKLCDLPRISYLQENYESSMLIDDVLNLEINNI